MTTMMDALSQSLRSLNSFVDEPIDEDESTSARQWPAKETCKCGPSCNIYNNFSSGIEEPAPSATFDGLMHSNVEMLVIITKDKQAWRNLQQAMREGRYGANTTSMSLQQSISPLLKEQYREVGFRKKELLSQCYDESSNLCKEEIDESSTLETASLDSWDDEDDTSLEDSFCNTDTTPDLSPISYKDIDLLQYPRHQILGDKNLPRVHPAVQFV